MESVGQVGAGEHVWGGKLDQKLKGLALKSTQKQGISSGTHSTCLIPLPFYILDLKLRDIIF
jgi:hypothetical protein